MLRDMTRRNSPKVNYLAYLGGANVQDEANFYFKSCFELDNDLFRNLCWHGSKKNRVKVALKSTRFAEACEAAMNLNKDAMEKPTLDKFSTAMTKAIKNAKEGFRRKRAAVNELEEQPPQRRARVLLPRTNPTIAPANVEEKNEDAEDEDAEDEDAEDDPAGEDQQEEQPEEQDYERNETNLNALHYVDNEKLVNDDAQDDPDEDLDLFASIS
ncbi:unnamed protein product [Arctia plantaginis]|uniref:Uncharacterized protein n=1 Tax=Arctia plantaginis TaxID=874455 RepID=A0A8S1BJD3_ARCPL|nr:unnamed protein product [Arctia plantaginis]